MTAKLFAVRDPDPTYSLQSPVYGLRGRRTQPPARVPTRAHLKRDNAKDAASTLVHEMAHLWRHGQPNPPRNGYHDRQWADKMESLGLMPSSTAAPGGARVGYR